MRRRSPRYGLLLLTTAVAAAICLSLMAFFSDTSSFLSNAVGTLASPLRRARTAITQTVQSWHTYVNGYNDLLEEKKALEEQLSDYETAVRKAEETEAENQRLRQLLGLREKRDDLQFAIGNITQQDSSNWSDILTLDCGTQDDVAAGDCVVDSCGNLVGLITEVGLNWSTLRTVVDSDSSIGAAVFRSGSLALAVGSFSLMAEKRLQLDFLGALPEVMVGDLITTSGLGGYLPPSLVIGYVEELRTGDDGTTQCAILSPKADLQHLTQVFVVTDFEVID